MKALVASLMLVLVLAGCQDVAEEGPDFDGDAAYAFTEGLVLDGDGLRDRVPGSDGHADTAAWLQAAMDVPGWTVTDEVFSGAEYLAEDAGAVRTYRDRDACEEQQSTIRNITFHNLVATWDGLGDETVLLGAHWDQKAHASQDPGRPEDVVPGANDGASGVGVLLQLMRHVADGELRPTTDLRIVLFDGEDGFEDCHPLAGSIYHAATNGEAVSSMILLDMVGDPEARFILERNSHDAAPRLTDLLWQTLQETAPDNLAPLIEGRTAHCSVLDDHIPFIERGIPAVDLIDFGRGYDEDGSGFCAFPPWWHTTEDTLENVDPAMLEAVGDTLWLVLEDPGLHAAVA